VVADKALIVTAMNDKLKQLAKSFMTLLLQYEVYVNYRKRLAL
jgi:hypothetical protein